MVSEEDTRFLDRFAGDNVWGSECDCLGEGFGISQIVVLEGGRAEGPCDKLKGGGALADVRGVAGGCVDGNEDNDDADDMDDEAGGGIIGKPGTIDKFDVGGGRVGRGPLIGRVTGVVNGGFIGAVSCADDDGGTGQQLQAA